MSRLALRVTWRPSWAVTKCEYRGATEGIALETRDTESDEDAHAKSSVMSWWTSDGRSSPQILG